LNLNIPLFNGSIFNLHRVFQIESGLTLLIMGIGFMIVPRFRNTSIGSLTIIKISFLFIILSSLLAIASTINIFKSNINEQIVFFSQIFRVLGILIFLGKIFDTLKIKPKLLRDADCFIALSSICLLIISILNLLKVNGNTLLSIEIQLLFPIIMIFGIEYKTLPSFLGFIRPRKKIGMLSLLFLTTTFIIGIIAELFTDNTLLPILFNLFMLSSSITFSISTYVYNDYENKKYILQSTGDKKDRYLYTLYHTRVSFYFLFIGSAFGLMFYLFDKTFIFYDLSIHFIAIGFIGITIASYLPMMLAPILGKPIAVKKFNNIPLILITISLLIRSIGMMHISYFNDSDLFILHVSTSLSGFLILFAIAVFITLLYKSIKSLPQNSMKIS
jgi:hypothetical protein